MRKIISIILIIVCTLSISACTTKTRPLADLDYNSINKVQVISAMGNPAYGADSKIIVAKQEVENFIITFNSGIVGEKIGDDDILIGFTSKYIFYNDNNEVAQFYFNANNTKVVALENVYYDVKYGKDIDSPYKLYKNSKSSEIVVDIDGKEMDLIRYNGETYVKSKLTLENIEWLEKYNSLTDDEKMTISFTPDLGEPFKPN